jgi:fatty-acyl-CoA synthase
VGAVAVTLNWRLTVSELLHPLKDAGVEVLFAGPEQAELAEQLRAEWGGRIVSVPDAYDAYASEPVAGAAGNAYRPDAPALGAAASGYRGIAELPGDGDPVLMVYTSGTTGTPKGAVLTHANLFWNAINDILALGLTYRDTTLTVLPLMHVGGIGLFTLPTLLAGGTVVMTRSFDAEGTLRLIESERVTMFLGG